MNDLKSSGRRKRRALCEPLEPRRLLNAGDLDLSFSADGKTTLPNALGENLRALERRAI
jgi:Planctomycete extracellular